MKKRKYKGFLSYSHHDKAVAVNLKKHIEDAAKFMRIIRRIRIFRDEDDVHYASGLTTVIKTAIDQSEYLLLLASPQSAYSAYVNDEVQYWLSTNRGLDKIIIVLWQGVIRLEKLQADSHSFYILNSDALPPHLSSQKFLDVPLYINLTILPRQNTPNLEDGVYKAKVKEIVARLLNTTVRELEGRERRALAGLATIISLIFLIIGVLALYANRQKNATLAEAASRFYALSSIESEEHKDIRRSLALACEAYSQASTKDPKFETYSWRVGFLSKRAPLAVLKVPELLYRASFSNDSEIVALVKRNHKLEVLNLLTNQALFAPFDTTDFVVCTDPVYKIDPVFSSDKRYLAAISKKQDSEDLYLFLWDVRSGKIRLKEKIEITDSGLPTKAKVCGLLFSSDNKTLIINAFPEPNNVYQDNPEISLLAWKLPRLQKVVPEKPIRTSYWVTGGVRQYPFPLSEKRPWTAATKYDVNNHQTSIRVLNLYTGQQVCKLPDKGLYPGLIIHLVISPSGRFLFYKQMQDKKYYGNIVDLDKGKYEARFALDKDFSFRGFGESDTTYMISESNGSKAKVISIPSNNILMTFLGNNDTFNEAEYFEKSRKVVTLTSNQEYQIYKCAMNSLITTPPRTLMKYDRRSWYKVSPKGDRIGIGTDDGSFIVWHLDDGQEVKVHTQLANQNSLVRKALLREDDKAVLLLRSSIVNRKKVNLEFWDLVRKKIIWNDTSIPESAIDPKFLFFDHYGSNALVWYTESGNTPQTLLKVIQIASGKILNQGSIPYTIKELIWASSKGSFIALGDKGKKTGVIELKVNKGFRTTFHLIPSVSSSQYLALNKEGDYIMFSPPIEGLEGDRLHFFIWDIKRSKQIIKPLLYTSEELVEAIIVLFKKAEKVTLSKGGYDISSRQSTLNISIADKGKAVVQPALSFQPNRYISHKEDCFSSNLKFVLNPTTPLATALRIWETNTGYPVSEPFYHESSIIHYHWNEKTGKIVTITQTGLLREWLVANEKTHKKVDWKKDAGLVLAGTRFDANGFVEVDAIDRIRLRKEFKDKLKDAADKGDGEAKVVLDKFFTE